MKGEQGKGRKEGIARPEDWRGHRWDGEMAWPAMLIVCDRVEKGGGRRVHTWASLTLPTPLPLAFEPDSPSPPPPIPRSFRALCSFPDPPSPPFPRVLAPAIARELCFCLASQSKSEIQ